MSVRLAATAIAIFVAGYVAGHSGVWINGALESCYRRAIAYQGVSPGCTVLVRIESLGR